MPNGMPVRWNFIGSTGATSQPIQLYLPGTNTQYTLAANDWLTLMTMNISADTAGQAVILSAPAGTSVINNSTLLISFGGTDTATGEWHDECSNAMCGPQGVLPSILGVSTSSTTFFYVSGTGFVEHGPGYQTPNTQVNAGQAWNPLPTFTINVPPSTGAQS